MLLNKHVIGNSYINIWAFLSLQAAICALPFSLITFPVGRLLIDRKQLGKKRGKERWEKVLMLIGKA